MSMKAQASSSRDHDMPAFQSLVQKGQSLKNGTSPPSAQESSNKNKRKLDSVDSIMDDADGSTVTLDHARAGEQYWMVQWRLPQQKKHKTWDGDGVLHLCKGTGILYDMDGGRIASGKPDPDGACIGTFIKLGGKELEVDCEVTKSDFISGKVFGRGAFGVQPVADSCLSRTVAPALKKRFVAPLKPVSTNLVPLRDSNGLAARHEPVGNSTQRDTDVELREERSEATKFSQSTRYWSAHWRKPQARKHKTWDGDSFVIAAGDKLTMVSDDGKLMGSTKAKGGFPLLSGQLLTIAGKNVELDSEISRHEVPKLSGSIPYDGLVYDVDEFSEVEDVIVIEDSPMNSPAPMSFVAHKQASLATPSIPKAISVGATKKFVAPTNFYNNGLTSEKGPAPLHDPTAEGAIVMKSPDPEHGKIHNPKNRPVVPVVIDPILARHLRPHQVEGVKFMYDCVMGMRRHEGQGCILADEMGMGKTLQTITLIWTLLKQNCYGGSEFTKVKALIVCPVTLIANWKSEFHKWLGKDRVGILTGDKDNETIKRFINSRNHQVLVIGYERLRKVIEDLKYCTPPISLIVCDEGHRLKGGKNKTVEMFSALRTPRRIILSGTPIQNDLSEFHAMANFCCPGLLDNYPTFKKIFETPILNSRAPGCSEKQRELGNARHEQLQEVAQSFVLRREATILSKYLPPKHEYVVFVTPTELQQAIFSRILQADALSSLLRGTMAKSLAMIRKLTKISTSPMLLKDASSKRKARLEEEEEDDDDLPDANDDILQMLPDNAAPGDVEVSGKLTLLAKLLKHLREETDEKCIVVSHYTSTLNIIEQFCKKKKYTLFRLDGSTPTAQRQDFVNKFNRSSQSGAFLFLLSSKAGGVGLNLVGASRLVLIDSDWNPSHDLQSMARIHRDGQKRPVFIYRFLTSGTIDEKIYQRQVTKLGLSDSLMKKSTSEGNKTSKSDSFTHKELRDLFTFHRNAGCHTHELLGCPCNREENKRRSEGSEQCVGEPDKIDEANANTDTDSDVEFPPRLMTFQKASLHNFEEAEKLDKKLAKTRKAELASLGEWTHINCIQPSKKRSQILDGALQALLSSQKTSHNNDSCNDSFDHAVPHETPGGSISFLFEKCSDVCPVIEAGESDD